MSTHGQSAAHRAQEEQASDRPITVATTAQRTQSATADVVICVHNALVDVHRCLDSVARHTDARHALIIVDDGSAPVCREALVRFARSRPRTALIRNDVALGYTRAANHGLRCSRADFIVLLNSDTIVTSSWLERILECAGSHPQIGIIGPLSNAAGFQSVPDDVAPEGYFPPNPLPPGWSPEQVASVVEAVSTRAFPRVSLLNGFCIAIKRAVIDRIGYFDEELFPEGYGEESDYCLRAVAAGFALAVADHAYVYHAKTRSYSPARRQVLVHAGEAALRQRHGEAYLAARRQLYAEPTLAAMRREVGAYIAQTSPPPGIVEATPWLPGGGVET